MRKKHNNPVESTVELVLRRIDIKEPWCAYWPGRIQESAFMVLTKDELSRLGLEGMKNRIGVIPITMTISQIVAKAEKTEENY